MTIKSWQGSKNPKFRHGLHGTPEYFVWKGIKVRCYNLNRKCAKDYSGRGIVMCEEWRSSFPAFLTAVGKRPSPTHTIERIDNDLGYEPGNVRWATRMEQNNNKRSNVRLVFDGRVQTIQQWYRETGIDYRKIRYLLERGVPIRQILRGEDQLTVIE